ncbi:MAG: GxxExxY protein [Candidatus Binataceae bacterium]
MKGFDPISAETEQMATAIVDSAYVVHRALGPGLLESVYEACLAHEFSLRSIPFRSQVSLPVQYKDLRLESALRIDLLVADSVIIELKAVERMLPLYESQLLTYLKLSGLRLGLLINFDVPAIKTGIRRIVL